MQNKTLNIMSSRFASLLLESMADGVFTLNDKGIISSWNPSMERITGYFAKEAIGKGCKLLNFNRCLSEPWPTNINKCGIYENARFDAEECFLRHKNGNNIPVIRSARLVADTNGCVGWVKFISLIILSVKVVRCSTCF